ncbi:MAG TPA: NAD-dependent epimerase/dehydratase family protein [Acidimicrobiia bacterium]
MRVVVTGGAGFIGSNLVDALVSDGARVVVIDNFSTGFERHLSEASAHGEVEIVRHDLVDDAAALAGFLDGADAVVHLAANADVRFGWDAPRRDLEQNVVVTHNVLEAVRIAQVPRLLFSSTGSVYGEPDVFPTPEDAPFPAQTSLYGASKTAAEGYIAAYAAAGACSATVFRFVSVLGPRYSHGHVIDFVRQLAGSGSRLRILGDGTQRKSYLHVDDCVAAVVHCLPRDPGYEVFNLGVDDYCTVQESATWICERLGVSPAFEYTGGDRGWIGDNPFIYLDTARICATGWSPSFGIRAAVESTVDYLVTNPWLVEASGHA